MEQDKINKIIHKFAIKNAHEYGNARVDSVLGKVITAEPSLKSDMKALVGMIKDEVDRVNLLSKEEIEIEAGQFVDEFKSANAARAKRSAEHNFSIKGAEKGSFITRFPPEPGGYMHIGHTKAVYIENVLKELYDGKLMLYFDDTNPDIERQEYVDAFREDLEWLGIKFDREYFGSDSIPVLYKYAESAIANNHAYVCTCDQDKIKSLRLQGIGCEHKAQDANSNINLWEQMLEHRFGAGEAVVRLNSDIGSVNTTMRDPALFRIKTSPHYRQKDRYVVWPTYDFGTPIIDAMNNISDVIRGKEYEMRDPLYFAVLDMLDLKRPRITSFAKLNIENNITSKRNIRKMIAQGRISGWDDPRLVTIRALRRRGVTPEAIKEFSLKSGMGKAESVASINALLSINKKLLIKTAPNIVAIKNPIMLNIAGASQSSFSKGARFDAQHNASLWVDLDEIKDLKLLVGSIAVLKGSLIIKITNISSDQIDAKITSDAPIDAASINWIGNGIECEIWEIGELMNKEEFNDKSIVKKRAILSADAAGFPKGEVINIKGMGLYCIDSTSPLRLISL